MIIEHRSTVLIGWALAIAAAVPLALRLSDRLVVAGEIRGSEATRVQARLLDEFADRDERWLALVVSGLSDEARTAALVTSIANDVAGQSFVQDVETYFTGGDRRLFDAATGHALALVRVDDSIDDSDALARLRTLTSRNATSAFATPSSAELNWTGDIAIREDIVTSSNADLRRSELRALPVSFFILCFAFGALVAAVLPLGVGVFATLLTLAAAAVLADVMAISVMVQSVASLLGLALGIDYSLLMITQFRKALAETADPRAAARQAIRDSGMTIAVSGAAVAIGFAGLALVPVDQLRSIGIAGVAVPIFAVLLATTALPVALSWLGGHIDRGRLWKQRTIAPSRHWYRWAGYVCDRPWRVALSSVVPLVLLAAMARNLEGTFPSDSWLPSSAESVVGLERLKEMGEVGAVNRLLVLYELPEGFDVLQPSGRNALRQLHLHLNRDARTRSVRSALSVGLSMSGLIGRVPDDRLNRYVSADRRTALLEVTPDATVDTGSGLTRFVRELRTIDPMAVTGLGGRISIGGLPAATADYEDVVAYWLPRVIGAVAISSFLALALAFRSLLIPFKAVVLNLLAVLAAYGVVVLIFVEGVGSSIFGLAGPIEGVFPPTPILVFCAAFGISMDYEVFLISSIAKARREGGSERAAIVEGVARTGRLITSAAAIMIVVFGAFALGDVLPTQILGTALAVVVALDALLIRMALGPAVIRLAGRWNWWPGDPTRPHTRSAA